MLSDSSVGAVWPSHFGVEPASPWVMRGRQVTAWTTVSWDVIQHYVHPDLLPDQEASFQSRVRFYLLELPGGGTFREAAISLPVRAGSVDGEASLLLWSDSARYLAWARDGFGWNVVPADFHYAGQLWTADDPDGATGAAGLTAGEDRITLDISEGLVPAAPEGRSWVTARHWLAPRRILHRGGLAGETREVLRISPRNLGLGRRFAGSATLTIDLGADDPLSTGSPLECPLDMVVDFAMEVGTDVEPITSVRVGPST